MSKIAENVIKIAYENRANAMIAAKQAAEGEGRLQKMLNWLNDPANKGKATAIESGIGGLAAGGLGYGLTKALGGSNKWAWANAGMAGGGTAAGIAGTKYRKEIGDALRNITTSRLSDKEIKDWETLLGAQPNNGTDPKLNSFKQMIAQAKSGNLPKEAVRYLRDQMKNGDWQMPADWMQQKLDAEAREQEKNRIDPKIGSRNTPRDKNGNVIVKPHNNGMGGDFDPKDIQLMRAAAAAGDAGALAALQEQDK